MYNVLISFTKYMHPKYHCLQETTLENTDNSGWNGLYFEIS